MEGGDAIQSDYVLIERQNKIQRDNSFHASLKSFHGQKRFKQKICYGVASILMLIFMLTITSVILQQTGGSTQKITDDISEDPYVEMVDVDIPQQFSPRHPIPTAISPPEQRSILDIIVNNSWQQYDSDNVELYLEAEGGSWFYRKMAVNALPLLTFTKTGPQSFDQNYKTMGFTVSYPLRFDGPYKHVDGIKTPVVSTSTVRQDDIYIVTKGGTTGPVKTIYNIHANGDLWINQYMVDKSISNSRIFKRV